MNLTAKDMQDTLLRYMGGNNVAESVLDCRKAINDALRELWVAYDWPWYQGQQSIRFNEPEDTGTVTFDLATRRFTLTGGTWPSWATYGTILVGSTKARVTRYVSSTVIEIEDGTQFKEDIATASEFTIYRNEYPIPNYIRKVSYCYLDNNNFQPIRYVTPLEFRVRNPGSFGANPQCFTIQKDRNVPGGMVFVFWPYPGNEFTIRFSYVRMPREVQVWSETTGKVTLTADDPAIIGLSTAFEDRHAGCLLRIGRDGTNVPTPLSGQYPYSEELMVQDVSSTTALTTTTDPTITRTAVKYEISTLLDVDEMILSSAFTNQCYYELAKIRKLADKDQVIIKRTLEDAVRTAKSKASTNAEITYAGSNDRGNKYGGVWFPVGYQ